MHVCMYYAYYNNVQARVSSSEKDIAYLCNLLVIPSLFVFLPVVCVLKSSIRTMTLAIFS